MNITQPKIRLSLLTAAILMLSICRADTLAPMLNLAGTGRDPMAIDFKTLPILTGEYGIVSHGNAPWPFRNHSYVIWHDGRYWAMWSHGLRQEDFPEQHVRYSTSQDGVLWSEAKILVGPSPDKDFRYIARGFWAYKGELLALASHDESYDETGKKKLFGPSLELRAYRWDQGAGEWRFHGVVAKDTINNFPPKLMPDGQWAMVRRAHDLKVSMLVGGNTSPFDWQIAPLEMPADKDFRADEPVLSVLGDGRVIGLFRDNGGSKRLYRAVSNDNARTWTTPHITNFPDATSKFFTLQTSRGYHVLISNANPAKLQRVPLCLSFSNDGVTYTRIARLPVPTSPQDFRERTGLLKAIGHQYPHAVEHDGELLVIYSRDMKTIETIKLSLDEVDRLGRGLLDAR